MMGGRSPRRTALDERARVDSVAEFASERPLDAFKHGRRALPAASRAVVLVFCLSLVAALQPTGAVAQETQGRTQGEPAVPQDTPGPLPSDRLLWHMPDPEEYRSVLTHDLQEARNRQDKTRIRYLERVLAETGTIRRATQVRLTLEEVLQRVLENSYSLERMRFNPAIETTRIVEAEAAFDAVFFTNIQKANIDRPSGSQLSATDIDQFTSSYGLRKAFPTGMQVSGSWDLNRLKTALSFQQINPEYTSTFSLSLRQPLLRGFGIDFNRSQIRIANTNREISNWVFHRDVEQLLRDAEASYWELVKARRNLAIFARLLADFEAIYSYLWARKDFDVIPVQLAASKADLEAERARFVVLRAQVFDTEDLLLAVMNDPNLPLGCGVEIIPEDFPQLGPIGVDVLAEVQTALENRPEIKEAQLAVDVAKIQVGQTRNLELPRLDVTFRYTVDGLSGTADRAFDQMTGSNFISYFVGVEFELPIGNRAPRAAHRRSQLQYQQAEVALKALFELVILEVHQSASKLTTAYDQIRPSYESTEARTREVESLLARAERKDHGTLINELGARRALANARRGTLEAIVDCNVAVIELEQAKGTLLRYNNVVIAAESE
ncbi:MAG: TolC family protein [Planctomycetes bacterium]|nr:TolC family protein [Planctomycetota bacterium]